MSDNGEKKRPNAKYRLSRENASEDEIVYHYNRDRRLEKAPQSVRDLYSEQPVPKRANLFRPLINTRPKSIMFASIVIMCLAILIISIFGYTGTSLNLEGNLIAIQAIRYEDAVIVAVRKSISQGIRNRFTDPYTGAVDIAVADGNSFESVFRHRIYFTREPVESYRFAVPFNSEELTFVLQSEKRTINARIRPE